MDVAGKRSQTDRPLSGWYVISLRPTGGHDGLRRAAARCGARLLPMSPIALRALPAGDSLRLALAADRVVFTSPSAVRYATAQMPLRQGPGQIWLAVGASTAAALAQHGISAQFCAERMDSEGLLSLPALSAMERCEVGLITAPEGRDLLANTLSQRARALRVAHVYQRHPRRIGAAAWQRMRTHCGPLALAVSSGQALQAWLQQCPADLHERALAVMAVAASARLCQMADALGVHTCIVAASARPAALVQALAAYRPDSAFR